MFFCYVLLVFISTLAMLYWYSSTFPFCDLLMLVNVPSLLGSIGKRWCPLTTFCWCLWCPLAVFSWCFSFPPCYSLTHHCCVILVFVRTSLMSIVGVGWCFFCYILLVFFGICRNPNIRFAIKCGVQGPMKLKECVWVWNTHSQMGECARNGAQWFLNALLFWELHSCKSSKCLEPWLKRQTNTKLSPQNTIGKVLKCRCLKFPLIVYLDLKDLQLEHVIHYWKDIFEGYKILLLHVPNMFDLKKIWSSKVSRQQKP